MMKSFPLLSVRDLVMFPGNSIVLVIGRPFSLAAIKESSRSFDNNLVVTAQRAVEQNDLPDLTQLFQTGCLCKISNKIEFPDGTMKVLLQSESRFKIKAIEDREGIRLCVGDHVNQATDVALSKSSRNKILELLKMHKNEYPEQMLDSIKALEEIGDAELFIQKVGQLVCRRDNGKNQLSIEQIKNGIFIVDTLTEKEKSAINLRLARVQEILESSDIANALIKLEALA